jgi:putative PEP-CTERM system histidine kinase
VVHWIEAATLICGLALAALLAFLPRFGAGSWRLLLLILPASFSAGVQAFGPAMAGISPADAFRLSFALIIVAAGGGCIATDNLNGASKRIYTTTVSAATIALVALLYLISPPYAEGLLAPEGYIALGLAGYVSALFLLIISVIVLARLEQILRNAGERVRWEIKFLLLGSGAFYAAIIYLSSQVLLFSYRSGLGLSSALSLLHFVFMISCILIALSWKRSSGRMRIAVSHGAIYSSITLLSVGVYLIASSLIARWASRWDYIGLPIEALIFLLSAVVLVALFLGTGFRHRTRAWIRRNIFAGRYDYRQFWLEATERIRSIDPPNIIASAVADIVHRALGAIDISVWMRRWDPNRLNLLISTETIPHTLEQEVSGVVEQILNISEPLPVDDLADMQDAGLVRDFMERTGASLLVPLISSNRIVGVITVGSDRSGQPYDLEAREFLRALAGHAAGEFHKSDLLDTLVEAKKDEAFRAFSTFVLHDLKNFASTLSYIAQNAPRYQNNPEFQKDTFQSVYDTAEKMKRLCNSLRTFSGTLAAEKKPANLNQIVRSVADTLSAGISKHLKLELAELPPVPADAEEVKRVLQNLLLNAREAISEDGVISVSSLDLGDRVQISIQDNGSGMSREYLEQELFQPFHTTKSGGLGIGLFQSKKIMEAHKGTILVDSEQGKGTKVVLAFPVKTEEPRISHITQKS